MKVEECCLCLSCSNLQLQQQLIGDLVSFLCEIEEENSKNNEIDFENLDKHSSSNSKSRNSIIQNYFRKGLKEEITSKNLGYLDMLDLCKKINLKLSQCKFKVNTIVEV